MQKQRISLAYLPVFMNRFSISSIAGADVNVNERSSHHSNRLFLILIREADAIRVMLGSDPYFLSGCERFCWHPLNCLAPCASLLRNESCQI